MAANIDALTYFRININEIKKLGKEWGLSENEIDKCIDKALEEDLRKDAKKKRNICTRAIRIIGKCFLAIFLFICLFYAVTIIHEPTGEYFDKLANQHMYEFFRIIRLVTLPLHGWFHFTAFYDSECFIENPLFELELSCRPCKRSKRVIEVPANFTQKNVFRKDKLILYRNLSILNVSFEDIVNMYEQQPSVFNSAVHSFVSSDSSMRSLGDLFQENMFDRIRKTDGFHAYWETRRLSAIQAIRQLYRRPAFVPKKAEVSLEKTLIIDGPNSHHLTLKPSFGESNWLVQSIGSRDVRIDPPSNCKDSCTTSFNVTLNQGDMLSFDCSAWIVTLLGTGNEASMIFRGVFTIL